MDRAVNPMIVIASLLIGAAVFFAVVAMLAAARRRGAGKLEMFSAEHEEQIARSRRTTVDDRLEQLMGDHGWSGPRAPVVVASMLLFAFVTFGLSFLIDLHLAIVAALPASALVVWRGLARAEARRRRTFDHQLLEALRLLATQLESGVGVRTGLTNVAMNVPDPLHSELREALAKVAAGSDLVDTLKDVRARYPSAAMQQFVTALEIDRDLGGRVVPALRQAADSLQRRFDLTEEALAEVSQARAEFYTIVGGILGIGGWIYLTGDAQTRATLATPVGLVVMGFLFAWFAFGMSRARKIFRRAGGSE